MERIMIFVIMLLMTLTLAAQKNGGETISLMGENTSESFHQQIYEQTTLVKNGQTGVNFTAETYGGDSISLSQYKGKVVHLCFWGTWCPPCLKELKAGNLPTVIRPYVDNKDFVFIAVAQDGREALDKFFNSEKGKEYLWLKDYVCIDGDRKVFGLYADKGVPRSVIIAKDGRVAETSIGCTDYELALIGKTLKNLLEK